MPHKSKIGLFAVTLASVGSMVGSGWLFGPLYAAQSAGPAAILSWLLGGFCFTFIVLVFAELASMFPVMGGLTCYPFFTHGKFAGVLNGWIYFLCFVTISPLESIAVVQYASTYFPELVVKSDIGKPELTHMGYAASCFILFLIVFINRFSIKFLTKTNSYTTCWKLLVPFIIACSLIYSSASNYNNLTSVEGFSPYGVQGILASLSIGGIIFAFGGFQSGIILASETKNPQRNIPIAAISSIFIVTLLYILIQFAFIVSVPKNALSLGWGQISFSGDLGPFAGLTLATGMIFLTSMLYVDAVISPFGSALMMTTTTARVLQTLGNMNAAPKFVTHFNKNGAPENSLWVCFLVGLLLLFPFPGWKDMVAFLTSSFVLTLSVTPISLMVLRNKCPEAKRPFCLPYYKFISLFAFCICGLMMHWIGFSILLKLSIIVTLFAVLYLLANMKKEPDFLKNNNFKSAIWIVIYLLGFTLINFFSTFGGGNSTLSAIESSTVAILFSILIYFFAVKYSLNKKEIEFNIESFQNSTN